MARIPHVQISTTAVKIHQHAMYLADAHPTACSNTTGCFTICSCTWSSSLRDLFLTYLDNCLEIGCKCMRCICACMQSSQLHICASNPSQRYAQILASCGHLIWSSDWNVCLVSAGRGLLPAQGPGTQRGIHAHAAPRLLRLRREMARPLQLCCAHPSEPSLRQQRSLQILRSVSHCLLAHSQFHLQAHSQHACEQQVTMPNTKFRLQTWCFVFCCA